MVRICEQVANLRLQSVVCFGGVELDSRRTNAEIDSIIAKQAKLRKQIDEIAA